MDTTRVGLQRLEAVTESAFWYAFGAGVLQVLLILALAVGLIAVIRRLTGRWQRSVEDLPAIDPGGSAC